MANIPNDFGFVRLHHRPKDCFGDREKWTPKQKYRYDRSYDRWLVNQDGHNTTKMLNRCVQTGKLGSIANFIFYEAW